MSRYILAVDQSTQGTKGLLFDENGILVCRADRPHRQIVNDWGWVEHDPVEIMQNTEGVCADVLAKSGVPSCRVEAFAISNQRETSMIWDKATGRPVYNAIVWQCARAAEICERAEIASRAMTVRSKTGINLSPYFPAAKLNWLMENVPEASELAVQGRLACGTMDCWLVWNLTGNHFTDYSNASRTQLFNIVDLKWDAELCKLFSVPIESLPEVHMSDDNYGETDLNGLLDHKVPICGVLGDSHGALFGQNCRRAGQMKATYGTGSSVMLNIGEKPLFSSAGIVTSLAWGMNGKVEYVFEGNLNYTGAVISWLKDQVGLISSAAETGPLAESANPDDRAYFVPAFTGLGSPYWDSAATGLLTGVTRTTGRNEIVKACVECIAYQITDLLALMRQEYGEKLCQLRVDGGPTANAYLMQFQSDIAGMEILVPELQELSGMGAAYTAGISVGIYDPTTIFDHVSYAAYQPKMSAEQSQKRYSGWKDAIHQTLAHR